MRALKKQINEELKNGHMFPKEKKLYMIFRKILNIFCFGEEAWNDSVSDPRTDVSSDKKTKKEKILNFIFCKDSRDGHSKFHKLLMFLLIFTSGMGSVGAVFGIRPSYVVAFTVAVFLAVDKIRTLDLTENRRYLWMLAFMFVWGAYSLVQGVIAKDMTYYAIYLKGLFINIFLVFVIIDYVRDVDDVRFLLYCFAAYIAVCLTIGFVEICADLHIVNVRATSRWRPHSFYGNENDNGAVLAYGAYAIFLCFLKARIRQMKIIFLHLLGVTAFEIVMSRSRAAILGLVSMALFTALFTFLVRVREGSKKTYRIILASGFAFFVIAVALTFIIFTPTELVELLSGEGNKESDSLRFDLIISGIRSLFDSYGLGLGAGQSITLNGINLHNFYLELLTEYGVIIGGVFLALMLGIMLEFKEFKWSLDKKRNTVADGLVRSFPIALAVIGIGPSSAMNMRATWIIIGLVFAFKYVSENGQRTAEIK